MSWTSDEQVDYGRPWLDPGVGRVAQEPAFRPLAVSLVPEVAELITWLKEHGPEVLAGVADVDRTLIQMMMEQPPMKRLDYNCHFAQDALDLQAALAHGQADRAR